MTSRDQLRAWLAGRSSRELERTLTLRPDVLWGAPVRDLEDLADRLVHGASVAASVRDLPAPPLQVLEVLTAAGAGASLERAAEVLDVGATGLDPAAHRGLLERSVGVLHDAGLVWPGEGDRLVVNRGVHEVMPYPLGLGRPVGVLIADVPVAELVKIAGRWGLTVPARKADLVEAVRTYLADPARVRMLLGAAPESVARLLLDRSQEAAQRALADPTESDLEANNYQAYLRDPAAYADHNATVAWARQNGLGFGSNRFSTNLELPSETILALVGADYRAPFTPIPPSFVTAPVTDRQTGASASGAITEFLAAAMGTLEAMARHPMAPLKSGGIGARELAKVAKRLGTDALDVRVTLELALQLRLLDGASTGGIGTSQSFDEWRRRLPAERAADLLTTWVRLPYVPGVDRYADGRFWPALGRFNGPELTRAVRALVLNHLSTLDDGVGVAAVDSIERSVAWRLPWLIANGAQFDLRQTWDEARRLGVIAHGRLSSAGTALLAGDRAGLVQALTVMLPGVQTKALFGSDLTVVVPGSPDTAVVDLLDAVAVREGRGAASSWRVTPASVRGALDDGHDAADLEDRLRDLADGVLPQALEYLVRDVGRRHGHVQVRPATAIVQSDDEALLAEIAVDRALRELGLRQIASTVLVAEARAHEVVAALRAAGYLPLALSGSGDRVVQLRSARQEVQTGARDDDADDDADEALRQWMEQSDPTLRGWSPEPAFVQESPADAAERLTSGVLPPGPDPMSKLEYEIREWAPRLSANEVRQLAHAIENGEAITLRYRSSTGGQTVRVVSGLSMDYGHLFGWCHLRQGERTFALTNIQSVTAAPPAD